MSRDDDIFDADDLNLFYGRELEIDENKLESDFGEAVRIHREAGNALGMPEEAPSLDELAAQQDAEQAQAASVAPFVRVAPPSLANAKVSGQQLVQSGGDVIQVVDWHGPDIDATVVTLTLGNVGPPANLPAAQAQFAWPVPPSPAGDYRPYARITWGAQGVVFVVEVDLPGGGIPASAGGTGGAQSGSSVQLTLGASNVLVQVGMDASSGSVTYMQLGAMVSDLPSQKASPLFRTRYFDGLSTNATQNIPPCATQIYPVRRSDISKQLLIEFLNTDGTVIDQISVPANQQMNGPLPVPPDAFQVRVTNQTGGSIGVRVPFGLSF